MTEISSLFKPQGCYSAPSISYRPIQGAKPILSVPEEQTFPTLESAERFLRNLGIPNVTLHTPDFLKNPKRGLAFANYVANGLARYYNRGYTLFTKITPLEPNTVPAISKTKYNDFTGYPAQVSGEALQFNPAYPWEKIATLHAQNAAEGYIACQSPYYLIDHELGHLYHLLNGRKEARSSDMTDAEKSLARHQVSQYSATQFDEFVAEVFSGLIVGKEYPQRVLNLYREYKGFEPSETF